MKVDYKYQLRLKCEQPHPGKFSSELSCQALDTTFGVSLHTVIKLAILVPLPKQMD